MVTFDRLCSSVSPSPFLSLSLLFVTFLMAIMTAGTIYYFRCIFMFFIQSTSFSNDSIQRNPMFFDTPTCYQGKTDDNHSHHSSSYPGKLRSNVVHHTLQVPHHSVRPPIFFHAFVFSDRYEISQLINLLRSVLFINWNMLVGCILYTFPPSS